MASAVRGVHVVHVGPDGSPRESGNLHQRSWNNRRGFPQRRWSTAGCGFLTGLPEAGDRLAICEDLAQALALHWHRGVPVLAACDSLATLSPAAAELALLAGPPRHLQLELRLQAVPGADRRAGSAGALGLRHALRAAGVPDARIAIMRPDQDL